MDLYSKLCNELSGMRSLALKIMKTRHSDDQIRALVNRLIAEDGLSLTDLHKEFRAKGLTDLDFSAAEAVFLLEVLKDFFSVRGGQYEPDDVYEVVLLALSAGMALHYAGVYPAVERAEKFRNSSKLQRLDALGRVLEDIFKDHLNRYGKPPQCRQVFNGLKKMAKAGHPVLQEVDADERSIYWRRGNGVEEKTSYKGLQNRLTGIREKILRKKIPV